MEIHESPGEVSSFTPKTLFHTLLPYCRVSGQLNKFTLYPLNTLLFAENYLHNFLSSGENCLAGYNYATNLPSKPHTRMATMASSGHVKEATLFVTVKATSVEGR